MTSNFQERYLVDIESEQNTAKEVKGVPMSLQWNLDGDDISIFLNLGPLVAEAELERNSEIESFQ